MNNYITSNLDEFTDKVVDVIINHLNNTEEGKELTQRLLKMKLHDNPDMTQDEWKHTKQEFLSFLFFELVQDNQELKNELGHHLFMKLREDMN